jgi:hypothetical protein
MTRIFEAWQARADGVMQLTRPWDRQNASHPATPRRAGFLRAGDRVRRTAAPKTGRNAGAVVLRAA